MQAELAINCNVLIADADLDNRLIIRQALISAGFVYIDEADNGESTLEKILRDKPDLVIIDAQLPNIDGFEICKEIRANNNLKEDVILIMQTGSEQPKDREKAFDLGASDFVTKPINKKELIARSLLHLEKKFMIKKLTEFTTRLELDLAAISSFQKDILPSNDLLKDIQEKYNTDISSYYLPCDEIGGDFWGIQAISKTKYAIYNVDFSGHGILSAINTFRLQTILHGNSYLYSLEPNKFLEDVSQKLHKILPKGNFATMFYGIIDTENDIMNYSTSACPSPIVISRDKEFEILSGEGIPLGAFSLSKYKNKQIKFSKGDLLFIYSDALIETENMDGAFMTEEQISQMISEQRNNSCEQIKEKIIKMYNNWSSGKPPKDDLTFILISR